MYGIKVAIMPYHESFMDVRVLYCSLPSEGEILVGKVSGVEDILAHVLLPEYVNVSALLPLSELSSRRVKSLRRAIRPNQEIVVQVCTIDEIRGHVTVSMRHIQPSDVLRARDRLRKTRFAHSILTQVSKAADVETDVLFPAVSGIDPNLHPLEILRRIQGGTSLLPDILSSAPEVLSAIRDEMTKRDKQIQQTVHLSAKVDVRCCYLGVEAVKQAFDEALRAVPDKVKATTLGSPKYLLTVESSDELCLSKVVVALGEALAKQNPPGELIVDWMSNGELDKEDLENDGDDDE